MNDLTEEIEEARVRVAHYRGRAERPGSRLEDEFALEKARNRLLTLELKLLKLGQGQRTRRTPQNPAMHSGVRPQGSYGAGKPPIERGVRTKRKQIIVSARQKAEADFVKLQTKEPSGRDDPMEREGS